MLWPGEKASGTLLRSPVPREARSCEPLVIPDPGHSPLWVELGWEQVGGRPRHPPESPSVSHLGAEGPERGV